MNRLAFVINQNPLDGSAHALYCLRHCWWLAQTRPEWTVELIYPGPASGENVLDAAGMMARANLQFTGLPAVRKDLGAPFTLNLCYYWRAHAHMRRTLGPGDLLASASFLKLFTFLLNRRELISKVHTLYEVHQLAELDEDRNSPKVRFEQKMLARTNVLITTTKAMAKLLQARFPNHAIANVGLACGFDPDRFSEPRNHVPGQEFHLAYIGSVYREQGVEWLLGEWPLIRGRATKPVHLHIVGGKPDEVVRLKSLAGPLGQKGLTLHGRIPPKDLAPFMQGMDALVIPSLAEGRMPYVAITKAYDYLAMRRPILAAGLASITEILRDGQEALVFKAGDPDSLSVRLNQLLAEPSLSNRLARATLERARAFTWEARSRKYWEFVAPSAQ